MTTYVMIALFCNTAGCYWAPLTLRYTSQVTCQRAAETTKARHPELFDVSCLIHAPRP